MAIQRARHAWVRIRDEGERVTVALKQITNKATIDGMQEGSFVVDDLTAAMTFVTQLGMEQKSYEQNYREEWRWGEVVVALDTWPLIDPYMEIEAPTEALVRETFAHLGLDYRQALFGSTDIVYRDVYGIEILGRSTLLFTAPEPARMIDQVTPPAL